MTAPIRVLLVDDQSEFTELTTTFLESSSEEFAVFTAEGVNEALDVLQRESIECIVSDYQMPSMDGLEFLSIVRETYPDLPFIMFTGRGNEAIASEAITAGVTDYVLKRSSTDLYSVLANRIQNVSARWRTEQALREQHRERTTLFENLPGMVYRSAPQPDGAMEFVSQGCRELTGYDPDQLTGDGVHYRHDVVHPGDADRVADAIADAIEVDDTYEVTYRITPNDGDERWVWERGCGQFEEGTLVNFEGFITDITERKRQEREVQEHRRKIEELHQAAISITAAADETALYRRTVDAAERVLAFDSCWIATVEDESFVECATSSGSSCRFTSVSLEDESVLTRTYRERRTQVVDDLTTSEITGVEGRFRSTFTVPLDAETVFQAVATEPGAFSDDDLELTELLLRYATEALTRVRSQDALRTERDRFAALFRNVRDPIVQFGYEDAVSYLRDANPAFERVFGYDLEEARDVPIDELIVPEELLWEAREIDERIFDGEQVDIEVVRSTVYGPRDFLLRNAPVDSDAFTDGYLIYTDITEQKRREQALERHRGQLLELNQINSLIRDISQTLVEAETRETIERNVCDRIVSSDLYTHAWIEESKLAGRDAVHRSLANDELGDHGIADDDPPDHHIADHDHADHALTADSADPVGVEGADPDERNADVVESASGDASGDETEASGVVELDGDGSGSADAIADRYRQRIDTSSGKDPVIEATDTGDVQVIPLHDGAPTSDSTARGHTQPVNVPAVATIPLTAGRANYGVLLVRATRPDAFDAKERAILGELGKTIGNAINAVEQQKLLTTDTSVELEFQMDGVDSPLVALSKQLHCAVNLEGFVTRDDGRIVTYVTIDSAPPDRVLAAISAFDEVVDGSLICEFDDELLFEFTTTEDSCIGVLTQYGAVVQRITVENGNGELVAGVAPDSDVRAIVDAFCAHFPTARLYAKREVDRPIQTVQQFRHTLDDRLTDKQLAAMQAAYFARYFTWPRASTAEEVASSMGITSATLHYHLRKAQQKLLRAFFDDRE